MADIDDINDMIRKTLESDKHLAKSMANALSERLEALMNSLIQRTIKLGKRQLYISFPITLDDREDYGYYFDPESRYLRAREITHEEDWTGHLKNVFGVNLVNQYESLTFSKIIARINNVLSDVSVNFESFFGGLSTGSEKYPGVSLWNFYTDNDGEERDGLIFPKFFKRMSDQIPVFFISDKFVEICSGYATPRPDEYDDYDGYVSVGDLQSITNDESLMIFEGQGTFLRINYFIQFK